MNGRKLDRRIVGLASTHFVLDGYANVYAPLLPLLIPKLGLSLAAAGAFASLSHLAGSVSQLVFGHLSDRFRPRRFVLAGPVLAVAAYSFVGAAWSRPVLAALLLAGGLGSAAFHPAAAAMVHRLSGAHRGLAMSVHITAGSAGFALAPLVFAPYAERFGAGWTPLLAIPGLVALLRLGRRVPDVDVASGKGERGVSALGPYAVPLFLLYLIVVLRTLVSTAFTTFVPVLLTGRGASVSFGGVAVAVYLLAGGLGGFAGGPLADRLGPRRVIILSLVGAAVPLAVTPWLAGWQFLVSLVAAGILLQSTLPVNIVFAHQIAPVSTGTVSSLMLGVAWGSGSMMVPLLGFAADRFGVAATLSASAALTLVAASCALPLPSGRTGAGDDQRRPAKVSTQKV